MKKFSLLYFKKIMVIIFLGMQSIDSLAGWPIKYIPDPSEAPTVTEIDGLEQKAQAGDWKLREEFAVAYLYEVLYQKELNLNHGCRELQYGYRCRMMAQRVKTGQQSLQKILDTEVNENEPINLMIQGDLQENYGDYLVMTRKNADPESEICKAAVYYLEQSVKNDLVRYKDGCSPAAGHLLGMARLGKCLEAGDMRFEKYGKNARACPTP